jgi:hypothetical protein
VRPLYAEARGDELGVVPMKSEEYRLGYSFEALRDLKQVPLTSDQARNGYFLHESLERLFTLMNDGYGYVPSIRQEQLGLQVAEAASTYEILERGFSIAPLQSSLFDRRRTRLLSSVRFRNWVLQEVSASTSSAYKCFLARGWDVGARPGVVGFLHPDGIYNDPKGASLRAGAYPRLRAHFQLINELRLFAEVHHLTTYGVNIYSNSVGTNVVFDHISNLFHPSTIDASYAHDGHGQVPGIKNPEDDFNWDLRGHRRRIVRIDDDALALFARLHDEPGTPAREARLPVVHSTEIVGVLRKFAMQKRRLADLDHFSTVMFDDTYAQRDGTIRRETRFPAGPEDWILAVQQDAERGLRDQPRLQRHRPDRNPRRLPAAHQLRARLLARGVPPPHRNLEGPAGDGVVPARASRDGTPNWRAYLHRSPRTSNGWACQHGLYRCTRARVLIAVCSHVRCDSDRLLHEGHWHGAQ